VHIHNRPQWVSALRQLGYRGSILLHLQNNHVGHWQVEALNALAKELDGLAVCSTFLLETFAERSPRLAAKTRVVFNGVNTKLFYPHESIREPKTIFFVGRFEQEKGVLQLVQAYARVLDSHPDAVLVIGGSTGFGVHHESSYVRLVRGLADSLVRTKKAEIHFPGYIHHDKELPRWFQRATVFASPSLFEEPFGLVNAEAMACGTPIIGSNRGGIPEVVGTDGIFVDPENLAEFASALSALLEQPEKRAQLGRAANLRSREMFDWTIIAEQWMRVLGHLSASRPSEFRST
jgi:spore coat protein SA